MSYTIDIVHVDLPAGDDEAWELICQLRNEMMDDDRPLPPEIRQLHDRLTAVYPCIMDNPDGPWSDGPLLNRFCADLTILGISYSRVQEVLPFVIAEALKAGFPVFDGQDERFHRPEGSNRPESLEQQQTTPNRPWWQFWKR